MKKSIETLRQKVKVWLAHQQRVRRRKLQVVRLEDRRLPDASFAMIGDLLSTGGFDAGDSLNVEFDSPANQLQLSLQNGQWDLADPGVPFMLSPDQKLLTIDLSLAAVNSLQIDAFANSLASVTDSGSGLALSRLTINGGGAVLFDNASNNFGQISVAGESLSLVDANDLEISHLDLTDSLTLTAGGVIGDTSRTSISVGSHAHFEGAEIVLGDDALDSTQFGSLSFVATGSVSITEDGDMELSGASSANELQLVSSGSIADQADTDLTASGNAEFTAAAITVGDDANDDTSAGTLTFQVTGDASFQIDGNVTLSGSSSAGSLTLHSDLAIHDEATADLTVPGLADLSGTEITLGDDTDNDTEIGSLKFNASGTVTLMLDATVDLASGSQATEVFLDVQGNILADSAGNNTAISASQIHLMASGTIGASSQSLLLNADQLQTTTTAGGSQFLAEFDTVDATTIKAGTGDVSLTSGTFRVSNTITAAQLSVGANARLGGTGTVAAAVTTIAGSTVSPGESPGILNSGDFELVSGSTLEIEVENPVAGVGYDQLNVTGTVKLAGTLDLVPDPLFIPAAGTSFTIVSNDAADAVIGQFAGLAEGSLVTVGGQQFLITCQGGDGNDVVLTAGVPVYDFDTSAAQALEGDAGSTIRSVTLTRSGNTAVASTVDVIIAASVGDTATSGVDFVARTVTVSFAAGETTQSIDVEILGDEVVENNETLSLSLANFSAHGQAGPTRPTMQIQIKNDDTASITVSDISELENGTFQFVLTLDKESSRDITVTVNTADLPDEAVAGLDYTAIVNQTVAFLANGGVNQTQIVTVTVNNELMVESDQGFAINLSDARFDGASDPTHVGIADSQGIATIRNDDSATISIGNVSLDEGDGSTINFIFAVSLSAAVEDGLAVTFNTADGTATSIAGPFQDFVSQSGTLTFVGISGEQQFITISVTADTWFELTETFQVQPGTVTTNDTAIDSTAFLSLAGSPATGTIVHDDTRLLARVVGGNLVITDEVPGGQANRISIKLDGSDILVSSANDLGTDSVVACSEFRFALASVTGQIQVSTRGGDDVLIVDFADGSPIRNADLLFDGGSEIATDGLVVIGDGSNVATYSPSATIEGAGRIVVDGDGISFVDLEPVDITGMAVVTVVLANADDVIEIANGVDYFQGEVNDALLITGKSGGVAMEAAALWNNGQVVIDTRASDGNDLVTIHSADNGHLNSSLTVRTGAGADVIQVNGNIALNDALHLQAADIVLGMASITTGLTQRMEGATEIAASALLTGSAIQFAGTVDSSAAGTHTLTVSGNAIFTGRVGTTSLASLHVTGTTRINSSGITTSGAQDFDGAVIVDQNTLLTATSVNFGAAVDSAAGELNDLNISGSAVLQGAAGSTDRLKSVSINGATADFRATADVGSGGISLTTTDVVQFSGAVSTTAGGKVLISNGGLLTLTAAADFTLDGRFAQNGAGLVRIGADIVTTGEAILFTSALTQLGGMLLNTTSGAPAGADITLASVDGNSHNLTLNAGSAGMLSAATVTNVGTLRVQNSGQSTFSGNVTATTLQIDDTTGAVVFNGAVNVTSLVTVNQPYAIEFHAGGTIVNAAVLANSGGITFGNDNADSLTFTGGLTSIVSTNTIQGTITTVGNDILLGTSTLVGSVTLQTSGGDITGGRTTGAGVPVNLNAGSGDISCTNAGNVLGNLIVTGHTVSLAENDDITQNGNWLTSGTTSLTATNNDIILNGPGNVFGILNLTSSNAEITESTDIQLGTSTLTSQLLLTTTGAVIDSLAGDVSNVTAADLTIKSVNGIGSNDSINTTVDSFSFTDTSVGNVRLVNTQNLSVGASANLQGDIELCVTAGDLVVGGLLNAGTNTVRLQSTAGAVRESATGTILTGSLGVRAETSITLATNSNNVQVFSAVSRTGSVLFNESSEFVVNAVSGGECFNATTGVVTNSGNIELNALAGSLQIDSGVTSGSGPISITAATGVVDINAVVSSTSGNIRIDGNAVSQDANVTTGLTGTVSVIADAGAITMADGTITSNNAGTISYDASGNVALSILSSVSGTLLVDAGGSISDALTSEGAGGENLRGIAATLTAATGIGSADDIDTAVDVLTAVNTASGTIAVNESTSLRLDTIDNGSRLVVLTTGGAITDDGDANIDLVAGTAMVTITGAGNFGTSSNSIETQIADLSINTATNSGSQFISELDQLSALNLNAGAGTISLVAGGAIEDADASADITAQSARFEAQGGIGAIVAINTHLENLAFRNSVGGAVQISNASDLRLSAVDGLASSSNSGGSVTLAAAGGIAFDVNTTALGNITANATESSVVNRENLSITGGVTVASTSGEILLRAGDRISISSTAVVQANTSGTQNITLISGVADSEGDGRMTLNGSLLAGTSTGTITLILNQTAGAMQGSTGILVSRNLRLLSGGSSGSFDLDQSSSNAVAILAADTEGAVAFQNSTALTIGTVNGTVGISTSRDNVTLCATSIALQQDVNAGTGVVRLMSMTGTVMQSNGSIVAASLGVQAATGINLTSSGNNVNVFAASGGTGSVTYVDADGYTIGAVSAEGCFTPGVAGIQTTGDFEACLAKGNIDVTTALNVSGTVRLEATAGRVAQTASGAITTTNLAIRAAGDVDLNAVVNQITNVFAAISTVSGRVEFSDAGGFMVGSVSAGSCVALVTGVTSTNGLIELTSNSGNITSLNNITALGAGEVRITAGTLGDVILNGLTTAVGSGNVIIRTADGSIDVNNVVSSSSGNILLSASGLGHDLDVDADIGSLTGHITLVTSDTIALGATVDIVTGSDGTLNLDAQAGSVSMTASSTLSTVNGSIRAQAHQNITIGDITSTQSHVSLISATGSVLDADANDLGTDVMAVGLRILASQGIGTLGVGANAIETNVTTLTARAGAGGIHVLESNGLTIGDVSVVTQQVQSNGTTTSVTDTTLSDLVASNGGSIVLQSQTGNLVLSDGTAAADGMAVVANGSGNILITTLSAAGDIVANSGIRGGGHISLIAGDDIDLNASVQTGSQNFNAGTVYLLASNRTTDGIAGIDMRSGASITTNGGNVRLVADNEADIRLGLINVGSGKVSLLAERSILDNNGEAMNVQAVALRMVADAAVNADGTEDSTTGNNFGVIGGSDTGNINRDGNVNAIDTQVTILAAASADGIYVKEADGVTVSATLTIAVQQTNFNSTTTARTDASLTDLTTTGNGPIKLQSITGSVSLNDGDNLDGLAVRANGSGDVLIQTLGLNGDVIVNSRVMAETGHITVQAGDDIRIEASVSTAGTGTVLLLAADGKTDSSGIVADGINMDALIVTVDGDVLIQSARDIRQSQLITSQTGDIGLLASRDLSQKAGGDIKTGADVLIEANRDWTMASDTVISAGGGEVIGTASGGVLILGRINASHVALTAGGDISDGNGTGLNIAAETLSVRSDGRVGSPADRMDLRVTTLAATASGGIYLSEADGLTIDTVATVTVNVEAVVHVNFNSTTSGVPETRTIAASEDLTTTDNGAIRLVTQRGTLTIKPGADAAFGVSADGTGAVLLESRGVSSDIVVNAAIRSGSGSITLTADDDLDLNAGIATAGSGRVALFAANQSASDTESLPGAEVDGINLDGTISTANGDILAESSLDIRQTAVIATNQGHLSLLAPRDILQTDHGDINSAAGNLLLDAGRDWLMSADTVIDTGGIVGGRAVTGELFLGRINATQVALAAGLSISDANGDVLNVAADSLSMIAGGLIGDYNNSNNTPSVNADAIDTRVSTIAAESRNGLYLNEADHLVVGSVAELTLGAVTFRSLNGLRTANGDMLLNTGGNLLLNQHVDSGVADVRITTMGSVTQNSSGIITADELGIRQESSLLGDIRLFSGNDANILAVRNAFDGGDIEIADTDDLTIRSVSSQTVGTLAFTATEGISARGGDVHIRADRDLTVLRTVASVNGVVDDSQATGESITLESVDGNILLDAGTGIVLITADEAPGSSSVTGDRITLLADSDRTYNGDLDHDGIPDSRDEDVDGDGILNGMDPVANGVTEGKVTILGDVTLSTDGGVAKKFGPRPAVGETSTAFFVYTSKPLPLALDNAPATWHGGNAYINAFNMVVGVAGEENLTVDIDWQDPANETGVINDATTQLFTQGLGVSNSVSSERIQQFLVAHGGRLNTVGHMYTALDFTLFQSVRNITTIVVDLSVSQHSSFNVTGSFVEQSATTQAVAGRNIASTDNALTSPDQFENAIASFRIPTTIQAPPALFNIDVTPRFDRLVIIIPSESNAGLSSLVVADFGGSAVSGSASSTEVYFQIRRQFETDGPAEIVVERITDSRLISSREAFEEFVRQNPELQDGAGYEIWLISETGGQRVERPVVEFEITGGQPGPASEEIPDSSEPPRLENLPFEQPAEEKEQPIEESPQASDILTPGDVAKDISEEFDGTVAPASDSNSAAEIEDDRETDDLSLMINSGPVSSELTLVSGSVMGLAVSRFRTRQRESEADVRKYSPAARFIRRNS